MALPSVFFFNFGWTDLLISVCLVAYYKDAYFYNDKRTKQSATRSFLDMLLVGLYLGAVGFILVKFFGFKLDNGLIKSRVTFTQAEFKLLVDHLVPISFVFGIVGLLSSLHTTYFISARKTSVIKNLLYTLIMVPIFFSTFPTLTRFTPGLETKVKHLQFTKDLNRMVAPYMLSNNYILLSKVSQYYGDGRPELQLQGRASADDPVWQQFDLRYKPGLPSRELTRVVPHIPRIDLKLWYAARSILSNNLWISNFAYRLATRERSVLTALAPVESIPKVSQMRVAIYKYKYSSKSKLPFAGYWSQSKFDSLYMSPTNVENLKYSFKKLGTSSAPFFKESEDPKRSNFERQLHIYLEDTSKFIRGVDPTAVIWTSLAVAAVSMLR